MSIETQPILAEHFALIPGVGVGSMRFGDRVTEHPELLLRDPEPEYGADEGYAEYGVAGLEETLIIYVDGEGRIDSASFYEVCMVEGRNLIGMGVGQLLVTLGMPSNIDAEKIGRDVELLYAYAELGLTIWTVNGEICVVQAGAVEARR